MDNLRTSGRVRVFSKSIVRVKRYFPYGHGKIMAVVGQEVSPSDVLGIGQGAAGFHTIYLAKELGLSPQKASACLKRSLNQTIYKGELLASTSGFLGLQKKLLLSPVDGILESFNEKKGTLSLKLILKPLKMASGVYGIVEEIDQSLGGVVIKTSATVICGVVGVGKEREGVIEMAGSPQGLTSTKHITNRMSGTIVVCGGMVFGDAIEKAIREGVAGLVCGGMNFLDFKKMSGFLTKKEWSGSNISLLVTEGFGFLPMGDDILSILTQHQGKYAFLDGHLGKLILPSREENCMIDICRTHLPKVVRNETEGKGRWWDLKIGQRVQIIAGSYLGWQGKIEGVDKISTVLASGVKSNLVTVLTRQQKIRVPYQNLEILG